MRIRKFGESVLKQPGEAIEVFDESLKQLSEDMLQTMYAADGIGLAAQQIGHAIQLFVLDLCVSNETIELNYTLDGQKPSLKQIMPMVMANPEVEAFGEPMPYEEGCLSFPDIRGNIIRPSIVRVQYQDVTGQVHNLQCDGIFARVILHEYDHLQGVLFTQRMHADVLRNLSSKLKQLKRQTRDFLKQNS